VVCEMFREMREAVIEAFASNYHRGLRSHSTAPSRP
jgi:hypothetical protein